MNSIRRPRSRPRVQSCNFHSLWWLVTREACWQILCRHASYTDTPWTRRAFAQGQTFYVRALAERCLYHHPERRLIP